MLTQNQIKKLFLKDLYTTCMYEMTIVGVSSALGAICMMYWLYRRYNTPKPALVDAAVILSPGVTYSDLGVQIIREMAGRWIHVRGQQDALESLLSKNKFECLQFDSKCALASSTGSEF